ncbi:protein of unknown function DUF1116 [Beutenbergia cavernae DSM 12333]|uniref:DUF1116 domain-containing protein n=1 Tax=Beutenbergia cavernae (strain ATCC BAA-8 / DSM 12333 / CCUG 43141 / JCM 11478 / NBRC 16432 / NCIMB 13614 / HKI 0122) TaxID=471853 RepID=C5BXU9_BEUC1|nr:DUF1116 domain-containing protein [Beutenbergia cavernae]ACQ78843.1 protein of unknown function DUF1116 [Beutenbergia cavernae DSM 12333]
MNHAAAIDAANAKVVEKITTAQPVLVDVVRAGDVIPELTEGKVLLHAGPPIAWDEMTGPMQGSCVGAALFEGWATTEDEARALLASEVRFVPCHHVGAVGPMGGITSAGMAVLVVEERGNGNRAYCTMNEGIGKVLRFGAYDAEVVERLHWMADDLGPAIAAAVAGMEDGLPLLPLVARAITMGDEFHQRNIAASALLFTKLAGPIAAQDLEPARKERILTFLADTDQFFLNVMMAACKAIMDSARTIQEGSVVTAMTRNGKNFGIRVAGLGDQWFEAPVNTPEGLFFTGFSQDDANPDIGDSAITEAFGVGGMAMIAAPGVTRFVGAGGFGDALAVSNDMLEIVTGHNPGLPIPTWDFQGACVGIDVRKVVATGITPIINTGIAHKVAGKGQVGAGTVRAPLACFEQALEALAATYGVEVD